jgi:hypothetical protein
MGQREDVAASLMRGDSRDGCARRKLADQVREVVEHGAHQVALAALAVGSPQLPHTQEAAAKAASAVVLASGLRAPANGSEPTTIIYNEASALTEDQWRDAILAVEGQPPPDGHLAFGVSPNREGWRARLANVERLLAASLDSKTPRQAAETVADALAEVRAMIDGDGE